MSVVESNPYSLPNEAATEKSVNCPAGAVATGGGAQIGTGGAPGLSLLRSQPLTKTGTATPVGWDAIAINTSGSAQEVTVFAICASP